MIMISPFLVKCSFKEKSYSNGDVYIGKFKGKVFHGIGKYTWSNGTIYEGDWVDGKRTGKGLMIWPSGIKYEGEFVTKLNDNVKLFHDNKKYIWSNRTIYEGDWVDGAMTGKGVMTWPSGTKYEGEFYESYLHGQGTLTKATSCVYKGGWRMDAYRGIGQVVHFSSGTYDGSWKEGIPEGNGKFTWKNGSIYKGNLKKGNINGKGIMMWANGDIFDGFWSNGLKHGCGVYIFANGRVYVGTWSKGLKDGKGTFYYPYGSKQSSLLKKLCAVLSCKVPKTRVNPSLSKKAPISGRSKDSRPFSHKIFNEDQSKTFDMSCVVYEREYKEGILIMENIIKYPDKSHNNKNKGQNKCSLKLVKKSSYIWTFFKTVRVNLKLNL
ncbi:phosphatidylinositol-4-phosphate 5-kinase 8-like protein [Trifolium pratense]|uniref:Phosphatidylinositol-4-phosphate 5-kinase 8-like protein n=1 Tax=Trifolium pratense TaxID=57577 RepID=A0A2K3LR28_TRIPR|nr:phosphatidylinositol-4-phosphate 5-kinase 8-like protein [Trifolium pratense]